MGDFENEMRKSLNMLPELTPEQRETIVKTASNSVEQVDRFGRLKMSIVEAARAAAELGFSRATLEIMIMECFNHQCELNKTEKFMDAHTGETYIDFEHKNGMPPSRHFIKNSSIRI